MFNRREEQNNLDNNIVLQSIQFTNQYLSLRARQTPGFWGSLIGRFSSHDYYKRRDSWTKILSKFNAHCSDNEKVTKENLIQEIQNQIKDFEPGFFWFLHDNRYHARLTDLLEKLNHSNENLSRLQGKVSSYSQIYAQMNKYRELTSSYVENFSLFTAKDDPARKTREKSLVLYDAHYNLLSPREQGRFLTKEQAHNAEYTNAAYNARY